MALPRLAALVLSSALLACSAPGTSDHGRFELLISGTADDQLSALAAGFAVPLTVQQLQEVDVDEVATLVSSKPAVLDASGAVPELPMRSNGDRQTFTVQTLRAGLVTLSLLDETGAELDRFTVEVREPDRVELHDSGNAVSTGLLLKSGATRLLDAQVFDSQNRKLVTGDLSKSFSWASMNSDVASLQPAQVCGGDCRPGFDRAPQQMLLGGAAGTTQVKVHAGVGLDTALDVQVTP